MTFVNVPFEVDAIEQRPRPWREDEVCWGQHDIPGRQARWRLRTPVADAGTPQPAFCDACYKQLWAVVP